jgi:hypothetical protein
MDKAEARAILATQLESLRATSYDELVERLLEDPETTEATGPSRTAYQLESQAFWDGRPGGDLRVTVSIDDGGWRAFVPLTESFIVSPDGSFVGE